MSLSLPQNQDGKDQKCDMTLRHIDPYVSLRSTLMEWQDYPSNWDQCGGKKPNRTSIQSALRFLDKTRLSAHIPEPMLHDTGRAGLFYANDDMYADIEFLEDGSVAYYVEFRGEKDKGVFDLKQCSVPRSFRFLGDVSL